jgi:hypothetical protein
MAADAIRPTLKITGTPIKVHGGQAPPGHARAERQYVHKPRQIRASQNLPRPHGRVQEAAKVSEIDRFQCSLLDAEGVRINPSPRSRAIVTAKFPYGHCNA